MQVQSLKRTLILASSSPYRKELLARLGLPFEVCSPAIDERSRPEEPPGELVARLAREKAGSVSGRFPHAVVIGSDQVAVHRGRIIGKPGTADRACRQLQRFSGDSVEFLTAIAVQCLESELCYTAAVSTQVEFRPLSDAEIRRYVDFDQPTDCAGAFKSESAGPTLLHAMHSSDPTAIIGLPLIAVSAALRQAGYALP
jgi:septum formation protein